MNILANLINSADVVDSKKSELMMPGVMNVNCMPEANAELGLFFDSIITCISKTVDPRYVESWKPAKFVVFVLHACWVLQNNKQQYEKWYPFVKHLLNCKPIYIEAAYIARNVYAKHSMTELIGGWHCCTDYKDIRLCDSESCLVSALYSRIVRGKKEYIYAIAGTNTESLKDWKNNVDQLYGSSARYKLALENAECLAKRIAKEKASLMFVGHSLGGGIATNNAIHTGHKAIVFNPAGISRFTMDGSLYGDKADELVTTFITTNDIINLFQDASQAFVGMKMVIPPSIGKRYYIKLNDVDPVRSHSIDQMINGMEEFLVL